jgi:hypothetical protein
MNQTIVGGWTKYKTEIDKEALEVFKEAMNGLAGVNYEPFAFSSQIVSGTNYNFLCNSQVVYPESPNELSVVKIYKPLSGKPTIKEIKIIN